MAKGIKTGGGSRKGIPNKTTATAKETIALAFAELGDLPALVKWARENPTQFYISLYAKLIPLQHEGQVGLSVQWPVPGSKLESENA